MTHPSHRHLRASGDGNKLGVSFQCWDTMRQYIQLIFTEKGYLKLQVANLVTNMPSMGGSSGGDRGPDPLENHKLYGFL